MTINENSLTSVETEKLRSTPDTGYTETQIGDTSENPVVVLNTTPQYIETDNVNKYRTKYTEKIT